MRDECALSLWRLKLDMWGYRVHGVQTLDAAIEHLSAFPVDAIATSVPGGRGADALAREHGCVLLFDVDARIVPGLSHRIEPAGPAIAERVREAVKTLTARKRGPKPLEKKPVSSELRPDVSEARVA